MIILVINTGSSSIKYSLYEMNGERILARGIADAIGLKHSRLLHAEGTGELVDTLENLPDHSTAVSAIFELLVRKTDTETERQIDAVGHRIGLGGDKLFETSLIDDKVLTAIRNCVDLAPIHMPHMIRGVELFQKLLPDIPSAAVFDTAFHATLPPKAYLYPLPYEYYVDHGIRRFGFHGTSHKYVAHLAADFMNRPIGKLKLITCHLGNGASVTAVKHGVSIDTSMGYTPVAGLPMGTRCGDIDPSLIGLIMKRKGLDIDDVDQLINRKSGFLGLSGVSSDLRVLEQLRKEGDQRAELAIEVFTYRLKKYIGSYAAAMGGLDGIVFTAGIGENSALVRFESCNGLEFLGLELDTDRNNQFLAPGVNILEISTETSLVKAFIVRTDEELMIARETKMKVESK